MGLFDKHAPCAEAGGAGKVFSELRGGPHYFESVNHVCKPAQPERLISDGRTPQTSYPPIYAAWFNENGSVVKLQMYHKRGRTDWLEESQFDQNNLLRSVVRMTPGAPTVREEYVNGILVGMTRDGKPVETHSIRINNLN